MRRAIHDTPTQDLLAAVLDELPTAVIIAEAPSGRIIVGNKQAEVVWRRPLFTAPNIDSYAAWDGYHIDGRPYAPHEWPLARAIAHGQTVLGELIRVRRGDGTFGVLRVSATPLIDDGGDIVAGVVSFDDVSAEQATLTKLQRLQMLGTALLRALTRTDVYDTILGELSEAVGAEVAVIATVNEARDEMQIIATNAVPRKSEAFETIPMDVDVPLTRAVRTNAPVWTATEEEGRRVFAALRESMGPLPHRAWAALPLDREGVVFGAIAMSFAEEQQFSEEDRDFMKVLASQCAIALDRARLYESERRARQEAEEANRAKDEFLAVLSHELRTPMTTILGWIDTIRLLPPEPEMWDLGINSMHKSAKRQERLISDLLDISRIVSGKLSMARRPHNLVQATANAIAQTKFLAADKEVTIIFEPAGSNDLTVDADPARIEQVLVNVLVNAIKFSPKNSTVRLRVGQFNSHAEIVVQDEGEGIPPDILPRIFDRFSQANPTYQPGLGLGLAIAKHIVERHGGRIVAHSDGPGKGATFRIELPLISAADDASLNVRGVGDGL